MRIFKIYILGVILLYSCGQTKNKDNSLHNDSCKSKTQTITSYDLKGRTILGKTYAEEELKKVLKNPKANLFYNDTILKTKEIAIAVAEPILFNIYGEGNIIKQRPYEIYLIDNYWVIIGTLKTSTQNEIVCGGTFLIILNSKNGQVISLTHGK